MPDVDITDKITRPTHPPVAPCVLIKLLTFPDVPPPFGRSSERDVPKHKSGLYTEVGGSAWNARSLTHWSGRGALLALSGTPNGKRPSFSSLT